MTIPKYIIDAARAYRKEHGGGDRVENAFIAGYEATRKGEPSERVLSEYEKNLFEECWKAYGRKGSKSLSLEKWKKLKTEEMLSVMPHLRIYVTSREKCFQKDFERYLEHRVFNDIIMDRYGSILYDPKSEEEYHPLNDGIFQYWDEKHKRLIFNGDIRNLEDGYTDDNRPDGATVAWGMYSWKWSKLRKEWVKQ